LIEMLRDAMLEKARAEMNDGDAAHFAAQVADHKRDPYTVVEEIVSRVTKTS
jgi:hypothetical protein